MQHYNFWAAGVSHFLSSVSYFKFGHGFILHNVIATTSPFNHQILYVHCICVQLYSVLVYYVYVHHIFVFAVELSRPAVLEVRSCTPPVHSPPSRMML